MPRISALSALALAACAFASPWLTAQSSSWSFVPLRKPQQELSRPTCMAVAPDGRIFLTERYVNDPKANPAYWANVRIVDPVKGLIDTPFLTITDFDARNERGLLGIALHPDFPSPAYVYLTYNYEVKSGPNPGSYLRLVRYTAQGDKGVQPVTLAEGLAASYGHNGGYLAFGPDDKLYTIIGDAWQAANAQDVTPSNWNGKCIRLEPDGSVPKDNPFGSTIPHYTLGHRNSFGHAFHPLTGGLYVSENGPISNDEINLLVAGKNYGWPQELGNQNKPGFEKPILTWTPTIGPVGVEFYRGSAYPPEYYGTLWVCDFNKGQIRILHLAGSPADEVVSQELVQDPAVDSLTDVKMGRDGHMYVVSHNQDQIYRIDWLGSSPQLPDLVHLGTPAPGNRSYLAQRTGVGQSGYWMLLVLGLPLQPPINTYWGPLAVNPITTFVFGRSDADGILPVALDWPQVASLKGLKLSYQSASIDGSLQTVHLSSNRVDLQVK